MAQTAVANIISLQHAVLRNGHKCLGNHTWIHPRPPWSPRSSYFFTPVAGCADIGCILQEHFEFQIPIASGDALESFFTPNGATALEIQVLEDDVLLHGELSTLELLACVTCAPQGRVKSCIALETPHSRTSASLRACSMPGVFGLVRWFGFVGGGAIFRNSEMHPLKFLTIFGLGREVVPGATFEVFAL